MDALAKILWSEQAYLMLNIAVFALFFASMAVSFLLQRKFSHYSKIPNPLGRTGAQTARMIAQSEGLNIKIVKWWGILTDYYNPLNKTIVLSPPVYDGRSIASAAVAAHETWHAIQDATGYPLLKLRSALVPVINIGTNAWMWLILLGFLLQQPTLLLVWIVFYAAVVVFYLITVPVEIDASRRAVKKLEELGFFDAMADDRAKKQVINFLFRAGMTYFLALASALLELLRLLSIFFQMQRRD